MHFVPQYPDSGVHHSSHQEEFSFTTGQATPTGSKLGQSQEHLESSWATVRDSTPKGQNMMRVASSTSGCSSASHMSSIGIMSDASSGLPLFPIHPHVVTTESATSPTLSWTAYEDDSLDNEYKTEMEELGQIIGAPTDIGLQQGGAEQSSPLSWDDLESTASKVSSPTNMDDQWLAGHYGTRSSLYVPTVTGSVAVMANTIRTAVPISEGMMSKDSTAMAPAAKTSRLNSESGSPRDDIRYKTATRDRDGLFHCPWEGTPDCNHKPEKLKCNYE